MFDVAFSELVVIAIVALVVIGPEKLPKVARTLGLLLGRLQRYVANVKSDIEREMQFEDLQKLQQEIKQGVDQAQASAREVENSIGGALKQVKKPKTPTDSLQ
jgi:sec-independent protein translocase protein TatB